MNYLIARIGTTEKVMGKHPQFTVLWYSILNTENGAVVNLDKYQLFSQLSSGWKVENLKLEDGILKGIGGSLDRYPILNTNMEITSNSPHSLIILSKGENSFDVSDAHGKIITMTPDKLLRLLTATGKHPLTLANGKVVVGQNGKRTISAIEGAFPTSKPKFDGSKVITDWKEREVINQLGRNTLIVNEKNCEKKVFVRTDIDLRGIYVRPLDGVPNSKLKNICVIYTPTEAGKIEAKLNSIRRDDKKYYCHGVSLGAKTSQNRSLPDIINTAIVSILEHYLMQFVRPSSIKTLNKYYEAQGHFGLKIMLQETKEIFGLNPKTKDVQPGFIIDSFGDRLNYVSPTNDLTPGHLILFDTQPLNSFDVNHPAWSVLRWCADIIAEDDFRRVRDVECSLKLFSIIASILCVPEVHNKWITELTNRRNRANEIAEYQNKIEMLRKINKNSAM